jgi:hypothetical protein
MDSASPSETPVVFRGKKRKFFRQRPADETAAIRLETSPVPAQKPEEDTAKDEILDNGEESPSVAEIVRQRNARKNRLKGVGFGVNDPQGSAADVEDELSLMIREEEQKAMDLSNGGVSKRFTAQTGLSSDLVNKHM